MTIVNGAIVRAAPCCGARYAFPRYVTMNFLAFAYWTDGWREFSRMPNDEGLRRCGCGRLVLLSELTVVEDADASGLPQMKHVPDDLLAQCIAEAPSVAFEAAARVEYWRHLNHPYRERYRAHRAAEEAATKAAWERDHPPRRTWWERLWRRPAPGFQRPPGSPFTFPAFEPTETQRLNMRRLSEIIPAWNATFEGDRKTALAELYREQGRFDEAGRVIETIDDRESDIAATLIGQLIEERQTAPMRYRM